MLQKLYSKKSQNNGLTIFLLLSFLLVFFSSFSQNDTGKYSDIDELKRQIRQSTYYDSLAVFEKGKKAIQLAKERNSLSDEATIYQYYGNFSYFSGNYDNAKKYYTKSLELARKAKDKKVESKTLIRMTYLKVDEDVIQGEKMFRSLLVDAEKQGLVESQIEILNGIGIIYESRQIYDEAMNNYLKALRIADKYNLKYYQAILHNNIGLIKSESGDSKEAKKDFEKGLTLVKSLGELRLEFNLINNLGLVNRELQDFEASVEYYKKTVRLSKAIGFPVGRAIAYVNLASSYHELKEYKLALSAIDSALTQFTKLRENDYVGKTYLLKAQVHLSQNQLDLAQKCINRTFEIHKKSPSALNYAQAFELLSQLEKKKGNYDLAIQHLEKYHALKDSIDEETNNVNLSRMQMIYSKEKVEEELQKTKSKNIILKKENELKRTRIRLIIVLTIASVCVLVIIFYLRYVQMTKKQQVEFSQNLIQKIDDERSRISKDLHDDIGQSLSAIKSRINMFNTKRLDNIDGIDHEIGNVINHTRNISHTLHPSFLEKIGLIRSLSSLLEKIQESTGIVCSLDLDKRIEELDIDTKTQLYRITQECINNTIKHAQATALKISIQQEESNINFTYRDNGKGIDLIKNKQEGIGMMTIRERVRQLKGKVTFENVSKGMQVIIRF